MSGETQFFIFRGSNAPIIEVDSVAASVYIRFKRGKIARTIPRKCRSMHIAIDVDQKGEVIGVEAVGVTEFSLGKILEQADVTAPNINLADARFRPVEMVAA